MLYLFEWWQISALKYQNLSIKTLTSVVCSVCPYKDSGQEEISPPSFHHWHRHCFWRRAGSEPNVPRQSRLRPTAAGRWTGSAVGVSQWHRPLGGRAVWPRRIWRSRRGEGDRHPQRWGRAVCPDARRAVLRGRAGDLRHSFVLRERGWQPQVPFSPRNGGGWQLQPKGN